MVNTYYGGEVVKNQTKVKIWNAIAIISFIAFFLITAVMVTVAMVAIIEIGITSIFLATLLVIAGVIFYSAIQKIDFYSCFQDQDSN